MSLTSLLQTTEVRERFRDAFEKPPMQADPERVAPPLTDRPAHVGTAFDYLLRFHLYRLNADVVEERRWVAASAAELLSGERKKAAQDTIEAAKAARDAYAASGELTEDLLASALRLAQLDVVFRTQTNPSVDVVDVLSRDPVREDDLRDLRQLHAAIPVDEFKADDRCLLNPTFGRASKLVGGADADLLVDETLVDVKTVQRATFSREMFDQLLGYYTLHVIGGIGDRDPKPKVERVGVYFSRHAHLHALDLDDVIDRSTYPDFVEWFALHAMKQHVERG